MKISLVSLVALFSMSVSAATFDAQIEARQDAYSDIKDNVEAVGEMLESGNFDYAQLEILGASLAKKSSSLKTLFPEGSQEGSNAKKAVWNNYDKFSMGLDKLNSGFEGFYAAAKTQDQAALVAGFKEATGTCKGCHRKYRNKK